VDVVSATMMVRINPHTSLVLKPQTSKVARKKVNLTLKMKRPNATIGSEIKTKTNAMIRTSTPGSSNFTIVSKRSTPK